MDRGIELILNSTHDAMIAVDKSGMITIYNRAAERLTKVKSEDAIGKYVGDVVQGTRLPFILKTGKSELNRQQKLIDIKIVTNRMPILDENKEIIGAIAVFRDISDVIKLAEEITNLKEIQSMLEAIFNSTQDAISVVNEKGIGVMVNPAYTRITGLSEKDVIGKPPTVDIAEGESVHLKVLATKKPIKGAFLKVGPARKEVLVNASPIIVDGDLRGSVAMLHDITEINKLSDDLKSAKEIIRKLEAKYTFEDIVGKAPLMREAIDKAKNVSRTNVTVLLRGESGTGKEIFAHSIHNDSERKFNQFIRVNCAAIPETLLESELFGYEEGAFTGAKKGGKKGLFEEANGGTIFLDEIGEIPPGTQAKLLRVLQEKEIVRVGSTKPINTNVRVIAATNADLEQQIKNKNFREDLYYRLNMYPIRIPSLRERKSDIYELVIFFMRKFNQEYGRKIIEISSEAINMLELYDWPGNVRELENVIGRAIINMRSTESKILEKHLPNNLHQIGGIPVIEDKDIEKEKQIETLEEFVEKLEKQHISRTLQACNNNKTEAAKILKVSLRTLYYKMEKYSISAM